MLLGCNEYHTAFTGGISSPNFPETYNNYASCEYIIEIPNAFSITIQFSAFELDDGYDILEYGTGTTVGSNTLGEFTRYTVPDPFEVESGSMWFHFTSDVNDQGQGFLFTWNAAGTFQPCPFSLSSVN